MVHDQRETARLSSTEPTPVAAGDAPTTGAPLDEAGPAGGQRAFTFRARVDRDHLANPGDLRRGADPRRQLPRRWREYVPPASPTGNTSSSTRPSTSTFDLNAVRAILPGQDRQGKDEVYLFHPPQRGDIIVFDPPQRSDKPYVKRVIGLPGDRIEVHDNKVWVNGTAIDEGYIAAPPHYTYPLTGGDFIVPAGAIFVLGDNRNNSSDSHIFGQVPLDNVIGKAIVSYWPPEGFGIIPHERYTVGAANP